VTQPLPHGPGCAGIARRHICVFVQGIRAPADRPLPGPAVTQQDVEKMFVADTAT
jgi:hypothetical protein